MMILRKKNLFLKHLKAFYAIIDDTQIDGKVHTSWFITMNMSLSLQEPNLENELYHILNLSK